MTFDFEERQGQLFDSIGPTDSLIFCISEDLRLSGKGKKTALRKGETRNKSKTKERRRLN